MHSKSAFTSIGHAPNARSDWLWALLACAAIAGGFHVLVLLDALHDNVDLKTHYRWVSQIYSATQEGIWYPRWYGLDHSGLGQPAVPPPAFVSTVVLFSYLTGDVWQGMKWATYIGSFLLCFTSFCAGRALSNRTAGYVAAVAIPAIPYVFFQVNLQAAFHVYFGLPWLVWFISASMAGSRRLVNGGVVLSLGALIFSHPLTAFLALASMGTALLGVTAFAPEHYSRKQFFGWGVSCVIGVCLGAGYLLPAMAHMALMNASHSVPHLDWKDSFVFPWVTGALYGVRWWVVQWVYPAVVLLAMGVLCVFVRRMRGVVAEQYGRGVCLIAVASVAFIFSSEAAFPIYFFSDIFRTVQWPYRFQLVASIASVLGLTVVATVLWRTRERRLAVFVVLAPIALGMGVSAATGYKLVTSSNRSVVGAFLLEGSFGQPESMLKTVGPNWRTYVADGGLASDCTNWQARCDLIETSPHSRQWTIALPQAQYVRLPLFFHPGWRVVVNEREVKAHPDFNTGLTSFELAKGRHEVRLVWQGLPAERYGWWVTGIAALLLIVVLRVGCARRI